MALRHASPLEKVDGCRGVGTATSIVILVGVIVHVFGGSDGLRKTRIMERMQWFILVEAN